MYAICDVLPGTITGADERVRDNGIHNAFVSTKMIDFFSCSVAVDFRAEKWKWRAIGSRCVDYNVVNSSQDIKVMAVQCIFFFCSRLLNVSLIL